MNHLATIDCTDTDEALDAARKADDALYDLCQAYDALRPIIDKLRIVQGKHLDERHYMNVEEAVFFLRDVRANASDVIERGAE